MIYKLIIALAGLFALFRLFRTSDNFVRTIVVGQIIAIGLTFIPLDLAVTLGFMLFILMILLVIIYAIINKKFQTKKRIFVLLISVPVLVAHVFILNHWPYAGKIGLAMVFPIVTYLILIFTDIKQFKTELGFLTILVADAAIKLSMTLAWIYN